MSQTKEHWENVFQNKLETEVSWYQKYPETSVKLINELNLAKDLSIIDIGGGDSYLIDALIELKYTNLFLLDISENAIERAKKRLSNHLDKVKFIVSKNVDFDSEIQFDIWHDRASFHFLTNEVEINTYQEKASKLIKPNGYLIIGTFSDKGPLKCSGLEITQYTEISINQVFNKNFDLIKSFTEDHHTPFNTIQNFIFTIFRRK